MKRFFIVVSFLFSFSLFVSAQSRPDIGCVDKVIKLQATDLQLSFAKQNMKVYKDAAITLNSQEPFPIAVSLNKGVLYQFIFVGSRAASKIRMEIFSGIDKKLAEKSVSPNTGNYNSNCILYTFTPETTDVYLIVLSQKNKHDNQCTAFTIMEHKSNTSRDSAAK